MWQAVKRVCVEQFNQNQGPIFETDPNRELVEEFFDTLHIYLTPNQIFTYQGEIIIEEHPSSSHNTRALGYPTVRVYNVYENWIKDTQIIEMILENSRSITNIKLKEMALSDAKNGGSGRENAVVALPYTELVEFLSRLPIEKRIKRVAYKGHIISPSVFAILEGIANPKYRKV
jgi:hypothetical protein